MVQMRWFAAVAAVLSLAACAGPKEATSDIQAAVPGMSEKQEAIVQAVGHDQVQLIGMEKSPGPTWFEFGPKSVIEKDGERVEINELTPGTPVRVSYESKEGAERVNKLQVLTGDEGNKVKAEAKARASTHMMP